MMLPWTRMPSKWIIQEKKLKEFAAKEKALGIASLMVYSAMLIKCDQKPNKNYAVAGNVKLSYSQLEDITSLSRTLISRAIRKLESLSLITVDRQQKPSEYRILGFETSGWAKFPARKILNLNAFSKFNLRHKSELNALKLLFLIIAFRDNNTNTTTISYEKIQDYTSIHKNDVCTAISLLVSNGFIQVTQTGNAADKRANVYRVCGIDHRHAGNMNYENFVQTAASHADSKEALNDFFSIELD